MRRLQSLACVVLVHFEGVAKRFNLPLLMFDKFTIGLNILGGFKLDLVYCVSMLTE